MSVQHAFAAALLDPQPACPPGLTTWNGSDPGRRFAVYRNNVIVSLVDALADSFPVTLELVGEDFFRAMARLFAYAHPPRSCLLSFYGDHFPDFIDRFPPAAGLPYLADVARLEFLRIRAYHAGDAAPVSRAQFAAALSDETALPLLAVDLHPSLAILDSPSAIVSLWAAHQGAGDIATVVPDMPETALVLRYGLDVEVMQIPPATGQFVAALLVGKALGDALEAAVRLDADFEPTSTLARLIQKDAVTALHPPRRSP